MRLGKRLLFTAMSQRVPAEGEFLGGSTVNSVDSFLSDEQIEQLETQNLPDLFGDNFPLVRLVVKDILGPPRRMLVEQKLSAEMEDQLEIVGFYYATLEHSKNPHMIRLAFGKHESPLRSVINFNSKGSVDWNDYREMMDSDGFEHQFSIWVYRKRVPGTSRYVVGRDLLSDSISMHIFQMDIGTLDSNGWKQYMEFYAFPSIRAAVKNGVTISKNAPTINI